MSVARLSPRKFLLALLFALLVAVGVAASLGVQARAGDSVEISGEQDDMVFAAGGEVSVSVTTPDDVFAAGGDVEAIGVNADHLSLAGGDLTVSQINVSDVLVMGGDVTFIDGRVTDDIIAAAGDLTLRRDFIVDGSAVLAGGDVTLDGPIGGELRAAGGRVEIDAVVGGAVEVRGNQVRIGPDARIAGSLTHRADRIEIAETAVIEGEIIALDPAPGPDIEPFVQRAAVAFALFGLLLAVGIIVLVLVAVLALPGLMNRSRQMLGEQPLATLGIGFLIMLATPAVLALLFVTVFGIPLGLLLGIIYAALAPLAFAAAIYALAMRARRAVAGGTADEPPGLGARVGWTALTALVFLLVALVPILGGIVWVLAFVFGLGAVATQTWLALSQPAPGPVGT